MAEWRDQRLLPLEQLCQRPLLGTRVPFTDGVRAGSGARGDPLELSVSSELALSELSELCGSSHVALRAPSLLQGPTFPGAVAPGRTVPARAAQVSPESSSLRVRLPGQQELVTAVPFLRLVILLWMPALP